MLGKSDAATDAAAASLLTITPLLGDYAIIGFGAVLGAMILVSRSDTHSRGEAIAVLIRAFGLSMILSLPLALWLAERAEAMGIPFIALLAPVAGLVALMADDLLGLKDRVFVAFRHWVLNKVTPK